MQRKKRKSQVLGLEGVPERGDNWRVTSRERKVYGAGKNRRGPSLSSGTRLRKIRVLVEMKRNSPASTRLKSAGGGRFRHKEDDPTES